jgi:hypothetical protein
MAWTTGLKMEDEVRHLPFGFRRFLRPSAVQFVPALNGGTERIL